MRVVLSTPRQMHAVLLANTLRAAAHDVDFYTSTPPSKLRNLAAGVHVHFQPKWGEAFTQLTRHSLPQRPDAYDVALYDHSVAARLRLSRHRYDLFYGWATVALASAHSARRRGARFALDRACPHVDFQQALVRAEAEKTGAHIQPQPSWYRDRQLEEYATADILVLPSRYSADTFPAPLQPKILLAPLAGRIRIPDDDSFPSAQPPTPDRPFTLGVVGGDPLRKGYLYLLRAWKKLALPNARLLLRSSANFQPYPVLAELLRSTPNVELVGYVPDISDFYRRCDAFVLPSVDDGFGMVLFEALANRVASIATTHCGASELLTSGVNGLVIPPFSEDALAEAILTLYRDPALRAQLATNGRTLAQQIQFGGPARLYENAIAELFTRL
jgi:glycosyltransferase involved in cell wall biosynthesis